MFDLNHLTMIIRPIHFWLCYRESLEATLHLTEKSEELDALIDLMGAGPDAAKGMIFLKGTFLLWFNTLTKYLDAIYHYD
jgi:hypothetical protein